MYANAIDTIHSSLLLYISSILVTIILIVIFVYGFLDSRTRIHKIIHKHYCKHLEFADYKIIINNPNKYEYHAPYGVETALITFNSETPYILEVIETCIERNRHLIQRYENKEDPEILNAFLKIELQLTSMIANQGISLTKRCRFYCLNSSKSFDLELNKEIVESFIVNANKLHDQFSILKHEEFKTPEVIKISTSMYDEFFEFFKIANELIYIHPDKKYKEFNKEDNNNDERRSASSNS